jgi:anti-sigma B factor antagonist
MKFRLPILFTIACTADYANITAIIFIAIIKEDSVVPNPFNVSTSQKNGISIIALEGYVDAHTAPQFDTAIQTEFDAGRVKMIVDCSQLSYIASAGLGVFMSYIEEIREQNGDLKIFGLAPKVRHTFEILGFPDLFEMTDDLDSALAGFTTAHSA